MPGYEKVRVRNVSQYSKLDYYSCMSPSRCYVPNLHNLEIKRRYQNISTRPMCASITGSFEYDKTSDTVTAKCDVVGGTPCADTQDFLSAVYARACLSSHECLVSSLFKLVRRH